MKDLTHERFLVDIANHRLTILRDDGLYRHLRLAQPDTYNMSFEIVTWKGYLAFVGDMGAYTFTRLDDMFRFFRRDKPQADLGYWAEKCIAGDKDDGIKCFSNPRLLEVIDDYAENHLASSDDEFRTKAEIVEAVLDETGASEMTDIHEAMRVFSSETIAGVSFDEFWDHRFDEFTGRFQWCCFALPWAIAKYDEAKAAAVVPA